MNIEMLFFMLARLLFASGLALIPSLMLAFFYNEPSTPYFVTIGISLLLFLFFYKNGRESVEISTREGIAITSFGWIVISLFNFLPGQFSRKCIGTYRNRSHHNKQRGSNASKSALLS